MADFFDRIIRASKLDAALYEEVEADRSAIKQAFAVIVLSSVAAGVGTIREGGIPGMAIGTVAALVGWLFWAFLTFIIGTRLLPERQTQSTYGELLRTIGFSSSPGLIRVLGFIPGLGALIFIAASLWMLVAMIIAVRQALDYTSTLRAVGVVIVGWLIQGVLLILAFALTGRV